MALVEAGYPVTVVSGERATGCSKLLATGSGGAELRYEDVGELSENSASPIRKLFQVLMLEGRNTVAWLERQPRKPKCVIVYGALAPFLTRLQAWCRRRGVPLIADVVEWYDSSQLLGGRFGPFYISSEIAMRRQLPRCDGLIVISSFLEGHYRAFCPVVRIPPTVLDLDRSCFQPRQRGKLSLIYAGTPGKRKDLLGNVMRGVLQADPSGERVELKLLGPTAEQVQGIWDDELPAWVIPMGRVPQQEVAGRVATADFSVLLREPLRFTQAGFPTKFAESLAVGTPIIGNLTSDMGLYLKDGVNGVVAASHSSGAFAEAVSRALELDEADLLAMREEALVCAAEKFLFKRYVSSLSAFVEKVCA